jgi:hypothetical protein
MITEEEVNKMSCSYFDQKYKCEDYLLGPTSRA